MTAIELAHINDGGAQMRVEMQPETVDEYATEMLNGASFPPVIVYHDGTDYWLGDGFHRVEAARKIERETIEADIREGTARDAIIHGIGANAIHGLRRTHLLTSDTYLAKSIVNAQYSMSQLSLNAERHKSVTAVLHWLP